MQVVQTQKILSSSYKFVHQKLVVGRNLSITACAAGIKNITVIGAGLMGAGIAQVSAQSGLNVTLVDQNNDILERSKSSIESSVKRIAKKKFQDDGQAQTSFVKNAISKIHLETSVSKAVKSSDLVIEAIVENLAIKHKLFDEVEKAASPQSLLASNTSSLSLSEIAKNLKRKHNFGGLHFFNPVPMMKLLEVVRITETNQESFDSFLAFGKMIGKETVVCKDTPGFIVNRLLVPYQMEALRMLERADASVKDIDTAMKLGASYPMGPFELADYVGLDTVKFILDGWHKKYPDQALFKPSPLLDKMVTEGKLGRKSGEGFYSYQK